MLARWSSWGAVPEVFDTHAPNHAVVDWVREDLQAMLSPVEFAAAERTILNAHYTDLDYTRAIWDALAGLGFEAGRVLEPGSGVGNFIATAPSAADMVGVEVDPTTAAIAQALHPGADIRAESFADTRLPEGSFDAAIGNVPFGQVALHDRRHNPGRHAMHNHFIIKALHLVKPGGVVAVITSAYTMDARNPAARREMAQLADLVGAVRLPTDAHQRTAGTGVLTDVLILRRREDDRPPDDTAWERTRPVAIDGVELPVNEYFVDHPEMVCGRLALGGLHRRDELAVDGDVNAGPALREALDRVVVHAHTADLTHRPASEPAATRPVAYVPAGSTQTEGYLSLSADGVITRVEQGAYVVYEPPATQTSELRGLLRLRDTTVALLAAEAASVDDTDEIDELRATLNRQYDAYVKAHGPINRYTERPTGRVKSDTGEPILARIKPKQGGFRGDPFAPVVMALEIFDPTVQTARKADIFTQRVIAPRAARLGADSPADALAICLDTHGQVRLDEIARLLGVDPADARDQLGELVFDEPGTDRLIPAAEYLSGQVRDKLNTARDAAATDTRYAVNVTALTAVIPADLGPTEIEARLGAAWIDADTVRQFLAEILDDPRIQVDHAAGSMWAVKSNRRQSMLSIRTWGIPTYPAPDVAQSILEQRQIRLYDTHDDGSRTFNPDRTLAAQAKAAEMAERFAEWAWADPARANRLTKVYNDQFNSLVLRSYDNTHLSLPGLALTFKPHPHQVAAVARVIAEPSVGLFHTVGAGKTAEVAMAAMELRRLGLVRKPAIVIPNHMREQFSREFLQLYPQARLLAASTDDLAGDKRRAFVGRAATGDWDAIIMTRSAFERIPLSRDVQQTYRQAEIDSIEAYLMSADDDNRLLKRRLEQSKLRAEERLKKLADSKDPGISFEQTGIDYVFADEAHGYKNLRTISNVPNMAVEGSQRATDLDMKLGWLRSRYDRVATLATGTPIANSMGEAYTMLRYLRPDLLNAAGITDFDTFAATFGTVVTTVEVAPEGGMRMNSRFAKFVNVPELLRMWHVAGDIKMAEDLNLPVPDQTPRPGDGQRAPETIVVPPSDELTAYIQHLAERADKVRNRTVDPDVDNLLKITTEGRAAALDLRLVGDRTREPTKIDIAATAIADIWAAYRDRIYQAPDGTDHPTPGALQIVFADLGTPKPGARWSVYDELRDQLTARGLPREQVRFIHEARNDREKAELFAAAREGRIAVLIGSTERMGVGTNVQTRAVALHHLDCPWRPADLEQREGRILRQGNQNPEVRILRYVTEGSFDGYSWQTVTRKAQFISQVMRGRLDVREIEDIGETALSYNEVKALATGNPLLLDQAQAQADVSRLERLERAHHSSLNAIRHTIRDLEVQIGYDQQRLHAADAALARRTDTRGDQFGMIIGAATFDDRVEATEALRAVLTAQLEDRSTVRRAIEIGELGGFTLTARVLRDSKDVPYVTLELLDVPLGEVASLSAADVGKVALVVRLENRLSNLENVQATAAADIARRTDEIGKAHTQLDQPYKHADALTEARTRLAAIDAEIDEKNKPQPTNPGGTAGPSDPAPTQFSVERMLQLAVAGSLEMDRSRVHDDSGVYVPPGSAPTAELVSHIAAGHATPGEELNPALDRVITAEVIERAATIRAWAIELPNHKASHYAEDLAAAARAETLPGHRLSLLVTAVNSYKAQVKTRPAAGGITGRQLPATPVTRSTERGHGSHDRSAPQGTAASTRRREQHAHPAEPSTSQDPATPAVGAGSDRPLSADAYARLAFDAFRSGDSVAALAAVAEGERQYPHARAGRTSWGEMRDRITAASLPDAEHRGPIHPTGQAFPPLTTVQPTGSAPAADQRLATGTAERTSARPSGGRTPRA